jgi:type VI secretion system secreted protein Hcp
MSVPYAAHAGSDMFLEFPNSSIRGEAQEQYYEGDIIVLEFSEGMASPFTGEYGGGGGDGKVTRNALAVTKYLDRSSPELRKMLVEGRMLPAARLKVVKPGDKSAFEYFVIDLEQVRVTKVSMSASGGEERLTEKVELTFAKIKWKYTPQLEDGSRDTVVEAGWDFERNQSYP